MTSLFIPPDNEGMRRYYENNDGGTCGVACLAAFFKTTVKSMIEEYNNFQGFSDYKELKRILLKHGYEAKQKSGGRKDTIRLYSGYAAIARIQWFGEDGGTYHGYKYWIEANKNTHYILVDVDAGYFFCNGSGWIPLEELCCYLAKKPGQKQGYITSYLEFEKVRR